MSKAKSVLGKDLMLFIDGKAIALATSCKLGLSAETIDTQSKDSGIWTEKDIKKLSWNASSENVFSADADANSYDKLFALFLAHKPVVLKFGVVGNPDVNEMPAAAMPAMALTSNRVLRFMFASFLRMRPTPRFSMPKHPLGRSF